MKAPDPASRVQIINEPSYSFGSADNVRRYDTEVDLTDGYRPSSVHGVIVDGRPTLVIGDAGGASGVHDHSLLILDSRAFVAVGAHVVCFTIGNLHPDWALKTDEATCFGVYYDREHDALISHGELTISRFSGDGEMIWSAGGVGIFSEGFSLLPEHIEAIDFDHMVYHFDYLTGESKRHNKQLNPTAGNAPD